MTLYALTSAGGAPGVTTAALALALSWPSRVIVAECDPSGGDVLAGLFAGHMEASSGLLPLAIAAGGSSAAAAAAVWRQLIELDTNQSRLLLAGVNDPRQAAAIGPSWPALAAALAGLQADVIADCGRLDPAQPAAAVLAAARLAVLVLRPTLRQLSKAKQRAEMLAELRGGAGVLALTVGAGSHSARQVERALGIGVAGSLADDAKTASVLSDGAGHRRNLSHRPLLRSAAAAGRALRAAAAADGSQDSDGTVAAQAVTQ